MPEGAPVQFIDGREALTPEQQKAALMDLAELRVKAIEGETHGRVVLEGKDIYDTAMHECNPNTPFLDRFEMVLKVEVDAIIAYLYT